MCPVFYPPLFWDKISNAEIDTLRTPEFPQNAKGQEGKKHFFIIFLSAYSPKLCESARFISSRLEMGKIELDLWAPNFFPNFFIITTVLGNLSDLGGGGRGELCRFWVGGVRFGKTLKASRLRLFYPPPPPVQNYGVS